MAKPAAGTLISSNALTADMVAAYLLNGPTLSNLVNSVGGADALTVVGSGMSYDSGTDSLVFTGAGYLQVSGAAFTALNTAGPAMTIVIGYKCASADVPLWAMSAIDPTGFGDFIPYNNGNIYTGALVSSRYSFATPGGITFSNFNQVAVTAGASGSVLFYINGVLENTNSVSTAYVFAGPSCHLGRNTDGAYLTGNIQFFYAWTRILSPTELATLAADPYGPIFSSSLTAQTITFPSIPGHRNIDPPFVLAATADSGLTVTYSVTSGPATISGSTVTITGRGSVTIQADQAGDGTYAAATPVSRTFTVTPAQRGNIAYDQIKASDRTGDGNQLLTWNATVPATSGATGTPGQTAFDSSGNYYWCYDVDLWARIGPGGFSTSW